MRICCCLSYDETTHVLHELLQNHPDQGFALELLRGLSGGASSCVNIKRVHTDDYSPVNAAKSSWVPRSCFGKKQAHEAGLSSERQIDGQCHRLSSVLASLGLSNIFDFAEFISWWPTWLRNVFHLRNVVHHPPSHHSQNPHQVRLRMLLVEATDEV